MIRNVHSGSQIWAEKAQIFGGKFVINLLKNFCVPVKSLHNMQFCEIYGYIKTQDN
jgi:hypothetical protein